MTKREPKKRETDESDSFVRSKKFLVIAWICIVIVGGLIFLALFRPSPPYEIEQVGTLGLRSAEFARQLGILAAAPVYDHCSVEVLTDGKVFYEAELAAIEEAARSIHLEAFIFSPGEIGDRFRDVLTERAAAGVEVRVLLDAIGSMGVEPGYFKEFKEAGGEVAFYHPTRWYTWDRLNNRTHREIIVIDGELGFVGGAGVADHWYRSDGEQPAWKDTMFRVRGPVVESIESVFVENWVEAAGEVLVAHPPADGPLDDSPAGLAIVFGSAPTAGGSTRARMVFQTMVASAEKRILITNPYFIPDSSLRRELTDAVERGVEVELVLPGESTDQAFTRFVSRRHYGEMLLGGVKIAEYQPTMNHRKTFVVDDLWSVVGSTNFDQRSFSLNDEINLLVRDEEIASRLAGDFRHDMENSRPITYEVWSERPLWQRFMELLSRLFQRQQ